MMAPAARRLLPVLLLIALATSLALGDPFAVPAQHIFSAGDTFDNAPFDTDPAAEFNVVTSRLEPVKQAPAPAAPPSSGFEPLPPSQEKPKAVPKPPKAAPKPPTAAPNPPKAVPKATKAINPIAKTNPRQCGPKGQRDQADRCDANDEDDDEDDQEDSGNELDVLQDLSDLLFIQGRQTEINVGSRRSSARTGGKSVASAEKLLKALQKVRGNVKVGRRKRASGRRASRRNKASKGGRKRGKRKVSKHQRGEKVRKSKVSKSRRIKSSKNRRRDQRKRTTANNKRVKGKGRKPNSKKPRTKRNASGRRIKRRTRRTSRSVFNPKSSDIKARLKRIGRNVDATQSRLKSALKSHDERLEKLVNDLVAGRQDRKEEIRAAIMSVHEELRKVGLQLARYEAKFAAKDHVLLMQLRSIEHQIKATQEDQAKGAFQSEFEDAQVEARLAKLDTKRSEVMAKRALTRAKIIDIRARARQVQAKVKAVITRLKRKQKQGPGQIEVGASEHAIENIRKALDRMTTSVRRTQLCPRRTKSKGRRGRKRKQKQRQAQDAHRSRIKKVLNAIKARQQELLVGATIAAKGGGTANTPASVDPFKALADKVRKDQEARAKNIKRIAKPQQAKSRRPSPTPHQHGKGQQRKQRQKGTARGRRRFAVQDQLIAEEFAAQMGKADSPPSASPNNNDSPAIIIIAGPPTAPTSPSAPATPAAPPISSIGQSRGRTLTSSDDPDDSKAVVGSSKGGKTSDRREARAAANDDASKGHTTTRGTAGRNANQNPYANSNTHPSSDSDAHPSPRGGSSRQSGRGSQWQGKAAESEVDHQGGSRERGRNVIAPKATRSPSPHAQSGGRSSQDDASKPSRKARTAAPISRRSTARRGSSSSTSSASKRRAGQSSR